jgi:Protein of unknown function (DUF1488)
VSVELSGVVDGRYFGIIFSTDALAELFQVPHDPYDVENAFMRNQAFMEEIARDIIERGKLDEEGEACLSKEDLLPYFERRAATAPA